MEKTLALIKPDAVKAGKAWEILQRIEAGGFAILRRRELQLSAHSAEAFYAEHKGKPFFRKLVDFMSSGPSVALVLGRDDAVRQWRALMGPTNAAVAREQAPESIRGLYGFDGTFNAAHGSDSSRSAQRELQFFFPGRPVETCIGESELQAFVEEARGDVASRLEPLLATGLTVLAREKPTGKVLEAVQFLGKWLIANNPHRPANQRPHSEISVDAESSTEAEPADTREEVPAEERSEPDVLSAEDAAIKVQAAYRGYCVRRNIAP